METATPRIKSRAPGGNAADKNNRIGRPVHVSAIVNSPDFLRLLVTGGAGSCIERREARRND